MDLVCPVPDGSRPAAIQISSDLKLPYREGLVKNRCEAVMIMLSIAPSHLPLVRYVRRTDRTSPDNKTRVDGVRRKLNAMPVVFDGKNVLLVDDSIIRGTTMAQIVAMVRRAGAKRVYLASTSPPVRFPNVYGINMAPQSQFIAHERTDAQICEILGADDLIYQNLDDIIAVGRELNPEIESFDASCWDGVYVTGDVDSNIIEALSNVAGEIPWGLQSLE